MFQEAFTKLRLEEIALILDRLNPDLEGVEFDPVDTTVMAIDAPFYPGYRFLEISEYTSGNEQKRFILYGEDKHFILNFTNEPIYALNKECPITLNADTVPTYVRFFFTYVRGRHGRFLICETPDEVNWKDSPPPSARKALGKMMKTLSVENVDDKGVFHLNATMIFKDSLFSSKISVTPQGLVVLSDEELLVENIPVLDDILGK